MKPTHPMPSQITRHPFSMVEIMLALGVVAIGVISIMGLFPIGIVASRDTAMETYAANAAEELLTYFKNYTSYTPLNQSESNARWDECFVATFHEGGSSNSQFQNPITQNDVNVCEPLDADFSDTIYKTGPTFTDTFILLSQRDNTKKSGPDMTKVDFSAVAKLWFKKDAEDLLYTLYAEISWPATRTDSARTKRVYAITLLNPYNDHYIQLMGR